MVSSMILKAHLKWTGRWNNNWEAVILESKPQYRTVFTNNNGILRIPFPYIIHCVVYDNLSYKKNSFAHPGLKVFSSPVSVNNFKDKVGNCPTEILDTMFGDYICLPLGPSEYASRKELINDTISIWRNAEHTIHDALPLLTLDDITNPDCWVYRDKKPFKNIAHVKDCNKELSIGRKNFVNEDWKSYKI